MSGAIVDFLREQIVELDERLVATLNARLQVVEELVQHKKANGLPLLDPGREQWLIEHLTATNAGPLSTESVQKLSRFILALTKQEVFDRSG